MGRMIEHAIAYAIKDWPVFPLAPGTKVPPKGHHGRLDATRSIDVIQDWWSKDPNLNIGIDTDGAGLVVIDIDTPDGDAGEVFVDGESVKMPFGIECWSNLVDNAGLSKEPMTYEVSTPSGGTHLYWLANEAFPVRTVAGKLAPGIDVRAINGSIVAAGSQTRSGKYEVVRDIDPRPLPNWLRAVLGNAGLAVTQAEIQARPVAPPVKSDSNYAQAAFLDELNKVKQAGEGTRNHQLNSSAYKLRRFIEAKQLDGGEVAQSLYDAAMGIGIKHAEAVSTIKSGLGV